jgi:hypothetical protein
MVHVISDSDILDLLTVHSKLENKKSKAAQKKQYQNVEYS